MDAGWLERFAAWMVAAVIAAAMIAGLLWLPVVLPEETIPARVVAVAFAVVGAVVVARSESRGMGWLLLAIGASTSALDLAYSYAEAWLRDPGSLAHGDLAHVLAGVMGQLSSVLTFVVLPLMFPTGRPSSDRWRQVLRAASLVGAVSCLSIAVRPEEYENAQGTVVGSNPFAITSASGLIEAVFVVSVLCLLGLAVAAVVGFVLRFRRSKGIERLQMRWLAVGLGACLVVLISLFAAAGLAQLSGGRFDLPEVAADIAFSSATLFLPFGIGLAVTRYRLYDVDRVVSRTVGYALLVATLAAVYATAVMVLGRLVQVATGRTGGDLVVAVSTLLAAALIQPLRQRIQRQVDRRFNRRRVDAAEELERFATRLRDSVALVDVSDETIAATARAVQPSASSLWLRTGSTP